MVSPKYTMRQKVEIGVVVVVRKEYRLTAIAALCDMVWNTGNHYPC